jgi:hypothetical protein
MNPYQEYLDRVATMYMQMNPDKNPDIIRQHVQEMTDRYFKNIPCQLHNNITHEMINTSVCDTFDWIEQRSPIISGNGTFFKQHDEYLAPVVVMLETLQAERKAVKKEMYKHDKKSVEYALLNTEQGSIKVIMNADYGGSGTTLSPFYSCYIPPATTGSAKVMTTTLICCLEMLSGNKDKWAMMQNINGLYDFINIVLTDEEEREIIDVKYDVQEVAGALLSFVQNYSVSDCMYLKKYLATLTDQQRTKLRHAFQVKYVLTTYLADEIHMCMDYLKAHQIDWNNITKESLQVSGFGTDIPEEIKTYVERINKVILDNCCYPFILNDNEVRAAEMRNRLIVCVTDTDSLMVHFASYVDEFQSRVSNFRDSCILASALGMRLFVEAIIPKMVKYLTIGCNIKDEYYRKKFVFKNEFGFLAMALIAKKMYASSMFVQEGTPRDIHDIAVSGLSFKKRDAAEFLEEIMVHLYDKYILTADHVSVEGILNDYQNLREKLRSELDHNPKYYQVLGLKDVSAYDPNKILPEQMRGAIIWNHLMPDEQLLPMDRVIVIRLSFDKMREHASDDPKIAEVLRLTLINNEKMKDTPFICLPEQYREIPEWIRPIIDKEGCIDKLLTPFKQLLSLFDVMVADTKAGSVSSRMICL